MITREFFVANADEFGFDAFNEKPVWDRTHSNGIGANDDMHVSGSHATRYSTDDIAKLTGFRPEAGKVYKIRIDIVEQPPE